MTMRYQDDLQAVVDAHGAIVLKIQYRSGEEQSITASLHVPGNVLLVRARQFSQGEGDEMVTGWHVHDLSGLREGESRAALEQRLTQALRAYGFINGFGASGDLPVIYVC